TASLHPKTRASGEEMTAAPGAVARSTRPHARVQVAELFHGSFGHCPIGRHVAVVEIARITDHLHENAVAARHDTEVSGVEAVGDFRLRYQPRGLAAYG